MTTENGKELGGHHCPDWDWLWVTPSSPEHEACTCYIGPTMTTNKPEVVAFYYANKTNPGIRGVTLSHDPSWANVYESTEPLIRLSDYETLQAEFVIRLDELSARNYELRMGLAEKTSECEELRKDAALIGLPDSLPMEPYQTVDRGSPHYKAGWNACRRAMLATQKEEISRALQYRDAYFEALMQALEQVDALKAECEKLRKDAEQQPAPDVSELVETLTMARETIAFALRTNAPDYFTTDADIARHVDVQRIDAALAAHCREPSHDSQYATKIGKAMT